MPRSMQSLQVVSLVTNRCVQQRRDQRSPLSPARLAIRYLVAVSSASAPGSALATRRLPSPLVTPLAPLHIRPHARPPLPLRSPTHPAHRTAHLSRHVPSSSVYLRGRPGPSGRGLRALLAREVGVALVNRLGGHGVAVATVARGAELLVDHPILGDCAAFSELDGVD